MMALIVRLADGEAWMLEAVLAAAAEGGPVQAAALIGGRWRTEGPQSERVGPYLRTTVSRAPAAGPADVADVRGHARAYARAVARLAPASRADVLERASCAATDNRDDLARLLALELGKPVRDGLGE